MLGFLRKLFAGLGTPKPAGPPKRIATIDAHTNLISESAAWEDGNLRVTASSAETVRLFELPLNNLDQCMLGLRFRMSSTDVIGGVVPEIWVGVEGFGEAFSKGLNFRLQGTNDWTSCELPFYLRGGQKAQHLKMNLVFEGAGTVNLREIELHSTPLE